MLVLVSNTVNIIFEKSYFFELLFHNRKQFPFSCVDCGYLLVCQYLSQFL